MSRFKIIPAPDCQNSRARRLRFANEAAVDHALSGAPEYMFWHPENF